MTSALVVIDVQQGMFTLPGSPAHEDAVLKRIAMLLGRAREQGAPVFHVQHEDDPGGALARETPGWRFHSAAAPVAESP